LWRESDDAIELELTTVWGSEEALAALPDVELDASLFVRADDEDEQVDVVTFG
jgi:hypothetical protein